MTLHGQMLTFEEQGHTYSLYVSRPEHAAGPLPAVIVLQEIWGLNAHIKDIADRFAAEGYLAVSPDLYAVEGSRPDLLTDERVNEVRAFLRQAPPQAFRDPAVRAEALASLPEAQRNRIAPSANTLLSAFGRMPELMEITAATFRFLKHSELCTGQIASVGFCMGGGISAGLAAAEPELNGAVVFYGRLPAELAAEIHSPVLGFFGELDTGITSLVPDFAEAMKQQEKDFDYVIYNNAKHAFFNNTGDGYDPEAAKDAWGKTISFLEASISSQ